MRFFTDETIKGHIKKYGREDYVREIQRKLKKGEEVYNQKKSHLEHILERVEKDFKD
ncbi:hypothetical protein LR010_03070 [Candidatus Gracilibacteria bacterium]|nr:hypothetical protein [Candidatus Gracilibacteria bacterium]